MGMVFNRDTKVQKIVLRRQKAEVFEDSTSWENGKWKVESGKWRVESGKMYCRHPEAFCLLSSVFLKTRTFFRTSQS